MLSDNLPLVSAIIYILLGGAAVFILMDSWLCLGFYFCKHETPPPPDQDRFFVGGTNVPKDKLEAWIESEWHRHNARWVMDIPARDQTPDTSSAGRTTTSDT